MTSTAGTAQHPDVSEISDFAEGLLPASRAAEIRHHLSGCPLCTDVQDSLNEVRKALGALPVPHHMPADIAGRIEAALAAETTQVVISTEEAAQVSRETSSVPTPAGSTRSDRPAGRPTAGTGPGRPQSARRRRRRSAVIGAAFGSAVIGVGAFFLQSAPSSNESASAGRSTDSSAPVFAESGLQSQVRSLLATGSGTAVATPKEQNAPSVHTDSSPNTLKRGTAVAVPSCIERGIGRDVRPLAVQQGTYHGTAAFLVVLPYPSDSSRVQAYVVDASCTDATPPARGKVLLTHTYPRG